MCVRVRGRQISFTNNYSCIEPQAKRDNSVMGLYPWKWEDNVNLDIMFKSLGNNTILLAVLWPKSKLYYAINVG